MFSDLFVIREAPGLQLRVDQFAIDTDLETATIGRHQRQLLEPGF
jgi:hypothetical protein